MTTRRLAAILAADVVGSTRLIAEDEAYALSTISDVLHGTLIATAAQHGGRLIKVMGDGALLEFASLVEAVACAVSVQGALAERAAGEPENRQVLLRIGVNLGDVVAQPDGDLYGDGVNVAARLESIADPGGVAISGKVHEELQGKLTVAFEDRGEQTLKNVARPVRVFALAGGKLADSNRISALTVPDKPSIAVLPLNNMSGDPEQDYFADGLTEDIITALSRVRWFFVTARNSTFTYKGRAVDVRQVAHELGVRYVLEGSVRKAGQRLRITGQLIDAKTGHHVWADRFDGTLDDVFDLQDRVVENVVGALEPNIRTAEIKRATQKSTDSRDAYDLVLCALPLIHANAPEPNVKALALLERALALDPGYAYARALAALCLQNRHLQAWHQPDERERGIRLAREAMAAGQDEPATLATAAYVIGYLAREHETALIAIDRAIFLNPSSAQAYGYSGWLRLYVGDPLRALDEFIRAIRLSPVDPETYLFLNGQSVACLQMERWEEALALSRRSLQIAPDWASSLRPLVIALVRLGRMEEAKAAASRLRAASPGFTLTYCRTAFAFRDQDFIERAIEAFEAAGIPE